MSNAPIPLSIEEAGRRLSVHPNTVRSWLDKSWLKSLSSEDVDALREVLHAH